jgi:hypothetical protein
VTGFGAETGVFCPDAAAEVVPLVAREPPGAFPGFFFCSDMSMMVGKEGELHNKPNLGPMGFDLVTCSYELRNVNCEASPCTRPETRPETCL